MLPDFQESFFLKNSLRKRKPDILFLEKKYAKKPGAAE